MGMGKIQEQKKYKICSETQERTAHSIMQKEDNTKLCILG